MSPLEKNGIPSLQDDWPKGVPLDSLKVQSSCLTCRHRRHGTLGCDAFPDGIPLEIAQGKNDHRSAFPGDNGVHYEPAE